MASTSGIDATADPTLAALVPRRSRSRNLVLLIVAVAVLVGVGWYGSNGRPTMSSDSGGADVLSGAQVLVDARSTARGLPAPTLESIAVPTGTRLVGAWVLDTDDPLALLGTTPSDAAATREALLSGARDERALPQPLPTDREFDLVVLLDVVDCAALPADSTGPSETTTARLRSSIGGSATVPLRAFAAMIDRQLLTTDGGCPAG